MTGDNTDKTGTKKKEDLRVVRTKKNLLNSFFGLLSEKTFEDITINELCAAADIRRATFYKHFNDKYDFLFKIVKMLRDEFDTVIWRKDKPSNTKDYYVEYIKSLVFFLDTHYLAAEKILESNLKSTIINIIGMQHFEETRERLERGVQEGMKLPASVDTVAYMLVGGITQIFMQWIEAGRSVASDILISEVEALIGCIIQS